VAKALFERILPANTKKLLSGGLVYYDAPHLSTDENLSFRQVCSTNLPKTQIIYAAKTQ